jgi:hypothetical protein
MTSASTLVVFALVVAAAPFFIQGSPGGPPLLAERWFMKRQASGVSFDGVTSDSRNAPGPGEGSNGLHGWGPVDTGDSVYYRDSDGLAAWHKPTRTWRGYSMSALARFAGWYDAPDSSRRIDDDIYGLAGTRNRIWMGTNGLGIVMLDVAAQRWSRYDVAEQPNPDRSSFVLYADDAYVFAWAGGRAAHTPGDRAESSYPGLEVYSIYHTAWMRISAVPRANVRSLATNHGLMVAMSCSQIPYSEAAYVPLRECGMNHPDRVSATADGAGYDFEKEFPPPGITGRFVIRRDQLEQAFSSNARRLAAAQGKSGCSRTFSLISATHASVPMS